MLISKRIRLGLLAFLAFILLCFQGVASSTPSFLLEWGRGADNSPGALGFPEGIAVDSVTGDVFVTDQSFSRVQRIDKNGAFITQWVCRSCIGADVNEVTHNIYFGNQSTNTVVEYTPEGVLVREWGGFGSADGLFNRPRNVAVDSVTGNVYVMDVFNARVQMFDGQGNFIRKWGSVGSGDGQFSGRSGPHAVTFDPNTRELFVSDARQNSIQRFDESGNFLSKWSQAWGTAIGETRWIRDIAIGTDGDVYVADSDNERIQIFTPDGVSMGTFNGPHDIVNGPFHPRAITVNHTSGAKYVAAAYAHRIDKFSSDNVYQWSWGGREVDGEVMFFPRGIAVSPLTGDVYVRDVRNFMVKRFTPRGNFVSQWGDSSRLGAPGGGWGDGLFGYDDNAITVDHNGDVWTASSYTTYFDPLARFVQKFGPSGNFLSSWPAADLASNHYRGIDVNDANVLLSEARLNQVRIYDQLGGLLGGMGNLGQPAGIARYGNVIYVVDSACQCIKKYDSDGNYLFEWGSAGTGAGKFSFSPYSGIALDLHENVYVADTGNNRVQVFAPDGQFIRNIGSRGRGEGQFRGPESLAISRAFDSLYVIDTLNNRVQAFSLNSASLTSLPGAPLYYAGNSEGGFLWKDYFDGPYHLRFPGSGKQTGYEVALVSSVPIREAIPVTIEADDEWQVMTSGFSLNATVTGAEDGVDFMLSPGGKALLSIKQNGVPDPRQLHVGASRKAIPPSSWVLPYQSLPLRPYFVGGKDLGLFVGRGSEVGEIEARWNGDGVGHHDNLSLLFSEPPINSVGVGLEATDKLVLTKSSLDVSGWVSSWWDGVDALISVGAYVGVSFQQDGVTAFHSVNTETSSLGVPNAYWLPLMEPYGSVTIDGMTEAGVLLWKESKEGKWHFRVTAGGGTSRYVGRITSDLPADSVIPVKLEAQDVLDASDPTRIVFDFRVGGVWKDGFDFQFPVGAKVSLDLVDPGGTVTQLIRIGESKWHVEKLPLELGGW